MTRLNYQEIENQIREAFHCQLPLHTLTDDEYAEWNHKISQYNIETVKKYLPLLLIREMYKDDEFSFNGTGDHLVYFLDGQLLGDKHEAKTEKDLDAYQFLETSKKNLFRYFTYSEAMSVLYWLSEVASSKYSDFCQRDVDSAIQFWERMVAEKETLKGK